MKLVSVQSSMLLAIGYDSKVKELEVVFSSGAVWRYCDVARRVYSELLKADSKGSYMHSSVIGMYPEYRLRRR